jgi:Txe/YoeB family toxin of toxin-antitoxin system
MKLVFAKQGWEDCTYWQRADRTVVSRIARLIDRTLRDPTIGVEDPEPLHYGISGA